MPAQASQDEVDRAIPEVAGEGACICCESTVGDTTREGLCWGCALADCDPNGSCQYRGDA